MTDHGDVVNAMRELEEKVTGKTQELEAKKTELWHEELNILADAERQKQAIQENMLEQFNGLEEPSKKRLACKREEKTVVEKDLVDLAKVHTDFSLPNDQSTQYLLLLITWW